MLALILQDPKIGEANFINATGNGQSGWKNLSYSDLSATFDKGVELNASSFGQINTDNPDLSAFKARGGKMIHVHGHADGVVPANGSINYYERVTAHIGGLGAVQDFYKLYLIPGMDHPPLSPEGQMYELITAWVEQGIAPDSIQLRNPGPTKMSPLICPYPKKPTYQSGDPNVANSFTCS
jgi:feruloyl esterase